MHLALDTHVLLFRADFRGISLDSCGNIFLKNTLTRYLDFNEETGRKSRYFPRKLLHKMLNKQLVDKVRNEEIYKRSHHTTITIEIKKRRLNWLGHMLRLPDGTPAKSAFKEHLKKANGLPRKTKTNMD